MDSPQFFHQAQCQLIGISAESVCPADLLLVIAPFPFRNISSFRIQPLCASKLAVQSHIKIYQVAVFRSLLIYLFLFYRCPDRPVPRYPVSGFHPFADISFRLPFSAAAIYVFGCPVFILVCIILWVPFLSYLLCHSLAPLDKHLIRYLPHSSSFPAVLSSWLPAS